MSDYPELLARIADLERRLSNMIRPGTVHSVDPKAKTYRMRLGGTDDDPYLGPPIPYGQTAGGMKIHTPPTVGQGMMMLSPSGDSPQGMGIPHTFSDANLSPSDKGDEHILTFGSVKIAIRGEQVRVDIGPAVFDVTPGKATMTVGGSTFELSDGEAKLTSAKITTKGDLAHDGKHDVTGSSFTHGGKDVGQSHRHGGISRGGDPTDPPL